MKALMVQLIDRVKAMTEACKDAQSDEAKERIDSFVRYSLPKLVVHLWLM